MRRHCSDAVLETPVSAREKNERFRLRGLEGLYLADDDVMVAPGVHRVGDTTEVRQRIQQLRLPKGPVPKCSVRARCSPRFA